MLDYLLLIFVCQLLGEVAVTAAGVPIPGPVIGMLLLFAFLMARGSVPTPLGRVAAALLDHLSLLFVPAGVGVILHLQLLGDDAIPLTVAMLVSTLAAVAVTGLLMTALGKKVKKPNVDRSDR